MDISVIVPIYNVEKYIEQALNSFFSQTKTDSVEFILVNDCATDDSMEVARRVISEYSNICVTIIDLDQNGGVAVARQKGMEIAKGEYTIHLDPDDWCESTMLEDLYNLAKQNDADIVACDFFQNQPTKEIYRRQYTPDNKYELIELLLSGKIHGALWNKLIKRSLYVDNKIGFIPDINMCEDLIVCIKLISFSENIVYLPRAYLHYRQTFSSITHAVSDKTNRDLVDSVVEIETFLQEHNLKDRLYASLMTRKNWIKVLFLMNSKGEKQREYAQYYPEANSFIWRHPTFSFSHKLALYCASKKCLIITKIIYYLIRKIEPLISSLTNK